MISCEKYADCWPAFVKLTKHFWPAHPFLTLVTDKIGANDTSGFDGIFVGKSKEWCGILTEFALLENEPILLMQEDFLLNAPVRADLIQLGLQQMKAMNAGCVRLYPCPGGEQEYGDPNFAIVPRGTKYRISCQAGIWDSHYLASVANYCDTPSDFEIHGTKMADTIPAEVIAFKREVQPWPLSYLCSAIGRGLWSQDAKSLCDSLNLDVDWSKRGFQPA